MLSIILPRAVKRFQEKSTDYGDTFEDLGLAGQYSDMHRKMYKLKKYMWHEENLIGEQPDEILEDLLGNILISLYLYDRDKAHSRTASTEPLSGQDTKPQGTITPSKEDRTRQQKGDEVRKSSSS